MARRKRVAVNMVFVDADRPSHVVLPLLRGSEVIKEIGAIL